MKKIWYLLTATIFILIILSFFKNNKLNTDTSVSLTDELNQTPIIENSKKQIIDFSLCDKNKGLTIRDNAGSTKIKILGPENQDCMVEITYDINGGSYVNSCRVPKAMGSTTFDGNNFDKISSFCTLKLPETTN